MTKKCNRLRGERPKAFWGALVGGAMNLIGSAISSKSQARAIRRQIEAQKEAARTQLELANNSNLASTLNSYATATRSYNDEDDYNLKYRLGGNKRLGSNRIYITDGGNATKIGNDTYLLRGGSHEQTNETGQTGIGINVGGNEIEAEGGEVAQKKNGALRIFSAQPILGGVSPAQAVMSGVSKDKVFNAQQRFKKRHHLSDGGETYKNGGVKGPTYNKQTRRWYNAQGKMLRVGHGYYSQNTNRFVQYNTDGTVSRFSPLNWRDKEMQGEKHTQSMRVGNKSIALKPAFTIGKGAMYSPIRVHKVQLKNNKNRGYTIDSEDITNDAINVVGGGEKLFGKKFKVQSLNTKFAIPYGKGITINGREVSKNLLDSIAYNAGLNKYPIDKLTYAYGLPSQESHNGRIASGNIVNKNKSYNTREYNNAIANMNVFKNFGVIPANVVVRNWSNKNDAATDKKNAYDLSTNLSPLYQSFDLFRRGLYNTGDKNHTNDVKTAGDLIINSPEFKTYWETSGKRQYTRGYNDTNKSSSYDRMINSNKEYSRYINHYPNKRLFKLGGRCKLRNGGLTSKDRGSSKHPYPSVASKDFAGGGRSYPIPTKADAVDALRLAGLHGRSDVKAKVYSRYPELRKKARNGAEIEPYYDWARNTSSNLGISFIDPTYDYRAYYDSVTPYERALIRFAPQGTHFTDIGKTPKHPTFSNESKYSNDKTPGGTWNGNVFVPNIWQFGNNGNSRRNKYMNNSGEGYFNGRVNVFPTFRKKHSLGSRMQLKNGGSWKAPVYNTNKYRVSNRMRRQIATWEGSDFAGQNRRFKGDAIGAKERELRQMMGRTYNYLNDNQRDSLNSIYYNSRVDTFKNAFGKWFRNLNSAVDRGDERAFNNSLAGIRQSMTVGANRKGMSGLAKRRAWERNWFGNPIPMVSNETKAILKQQDEAGMVQPTDNTRVVIQPEYIEVPAPVGHGVVPVDNPDPNLLQGNIKDNLINMGNKFRLGQRCGGNTRMRKALGGESRPVKGMRRKLAWGDVTYPYRRNNNFDYWDIIDQEQKANDKGGISPWTSSNKYDVKVPYAITKSTPTIPYTSKVSTPTSGISENKTIPTYIGNKSGMIIRDADWYGLGADLLSSIGGSILGLGAYKNLDFDYNLPNFVEESPVALNTTYHNEAQKSNVERNRLNSRNSILRNTMSGSTAVGRMQGVDTNALYQLNQLADEKTNKETELMNQNLLNEQQVRARNAAARNQYYNTVASIKNAAIQAKNEAELAKGQILSGSLQGIGNSFQNFISQGRQNYDDTQAMLMGVAASDYATPSRLLELGVDVGDDAALAGIYRSAMNVPNPGARPKREDYSDNTEYSYALTRWENQNKAYQRRNSYADLIKGRMSKKNLIKYGII